MIGHYDDLKFERTGIEDQDGLGKFVKAKMTGETTSTMKVQGSGILYCGDMGKTIRSTARLTSSPSIPSRDQPTLEH